MTQSNQNFKIGDIVRGRSMGDPKIRTWKILAISGDTAIGQNVAARLPYRQPLNLSEVQRLQ